MNIMIRIPKDLSVGKNRLITKIKRKYLDVLSVPVVKCKGCDEFIVLGNTYWNINDVDIKCNQCRTMDTTREQNGLKNGEKLEVRDYGPFILIHCFNEEKSTIGMTEDL